jgi:hypothetical protein
MVVVVVAVVVEGVVGEGVGRAAVQVMVGVVGGWGCPVGEEEGWVRVGVRGADCLSSVGQQHSLPAALYPPIEHLQVLCPRACRR